MSACYIVAEIGINHNGDLARALSMVAEAKRAGADAVKFQKRDPEMATPAAMRDVERDTPWGRMTYLQYRHRVEFGRKEYDAIAHLCSRLQIDWSASVWDAESLDFLSQYDVPWVKVPSALATNLELVRAIKAAGHAIVASTGMCTAREVAELAHAAGQCTLLHTVSAYPCPNQHLNLRRLTTLQAAYPHCAIGYSGHEVGLAPSIAAVAMGAKFLERHFTGDRSWWGSDQSASVEPQGFGRLVRDVRAVEMAMGDHRLGVDDIERPSMARLRK